DFEYNKLSIPKPDKVIFLDMPTEVSQKLLDGRYDAQGGGKDIHERDVEYLNRCREAAIFTADYSGWEKISCAKDESPRRVDEIAQDVIRATGLIPD
ncbi:MAG: thymidylate kinase, partial [Clostridia bacterium]|nr:thymidylate kinase [Clostridia bacterium]